jgi:quercetin dioxygenase-like cupin family protein
MTTDPPMSGRLREHPRQRFARRERKLDLDEAFDELLAEPHEPIEGHRQITVAKRRGLCVVLFHFEQGGELPEHAVDGETTIHVLDGSLSIQTAENTHEIGAGEMLILEPLVEHDVRAEAETKMLMTVCVAESS